MRLDPWDDRARDGRCTSRIALAALCTLLHGCASVRALEDCSVREAALRDRLGIALTENARLEAEAKHWQSAYRQTLRQRIHTPSGERTPQPATGSVK
ncbi:MAG: nickel-dependent hydrogenase large subunit [Gammaproteobacteria bacterium]|nr:nickel-dependent hydrogenase large subunit [Gammaproteobacteria bacterium]